MDKRTAERLAQTIESQGGVQVLGLRVNQGKYHVGCRDNNETFEVSNPTQWKEYKPYVNNQYGLHPWIMKAVAEWIQSYGAGYGNSDADINEMTNACIEDSSLEVSIKDRQGVLLAIAAWLAEVRNGE